MKVGNITIVLILVFISLSLNAQTRVSGVVYEDTNLNGKKDRKENGIPGVSVTNGEEVVQTDSKGRYEMEIGDEAIISVIKPSGYNLKTDENNLPKFFYNHKPQGSPKLKYAGVEPTGKLPESVDFGLLASDEEEKFKILVFGDPQPYSKKEVEYFRNDIVAEVKNIKGVSFGISLGDLVGNNLTLFNPYINAIKEVGIPWYNVMGNHDMNFDAKVDSHADETYEAHFGPANYAFNYGKVHFIVLDDILYPHPKGHKGYWGGFREDQLNFIENDLKYVPKDHLVVLAFHIPLEEMPDEDNFRDKDRNRLFELLKDYPNTLSLSAHTHIQKQDFFTKKDGWLREKPHHEYNVGTTSGSWYSGRLNEEGIPLATMRDGTPKGYAFIEFSGNQYEVNYKAANKPTEHQMTIYAPRVVAQKSRSNSGIYVNFFLGSEGDNVLFKVDDGEWKEMKYTREFDPTYLHLLHEWDFTDELFSGRRPPDLKGLKHRSSHLWRANVPTNLTTGQHTIHIKATNRYGKEFTAHQTYRIEEPKN